MATEKPARTRKLVIEEKSTEGEQVTKGKMANTMIVESPNEYQFTVWTHKGLGGVIAGIPGVYSILPAGSKYDITIDARYDREWVQNKILEAIATYEEEHPELLL